MFKALFVKCPEALAGFLASALKIERSTIKNVRIKNPELTPSCYEGKLTRLDILLELYDDVINIEMQVSKTADYKDRSLFYWARVYNDALKEGQSYNESKKCICINILIVNEKNIFSFTISRYARSDRRERMCKAILIK